MNENGNLQWNFHKEALYSLVQIELEFKIVGFVMGGKLENMVKSINIPK